MYFICSVHNIEEMERERESIAVGGDSAATIYDIVLNSNVMNSLDEPGVKEEVTVLVYMYV